MPVGPVQVSGRRSPLNTLTMAHPGLASSTIRAATLLRAVHALCSRWNYRHAEIYSTCSPQLRRGDAAVGRRRDAAVGRRGIAMALRARTGERYVVNVLPLTSGARRKAGVCYSAAAAMFIRKAQLDWTSPPEAVAGQFKLRPAEVRVLFAIVEIGGVPEVAPVLGISEQTVKSHLHHIFEKTATKRQADLVKLIATYSGRP
jgi:DNA-binding CsgD family transcriptional regulator